MKQSKPLLYGLAFILFGLVLFAYWNHFNNPFHFDDEHTIVSNAYIRDIKNIPLFFKSATTTSSLPANQAYRPGVTTLDAIDYWLGGKTEPDPFYYHRSIFISFLFLGFFIYLLVVKIFDKAYQNPLNPYIALLTTAVFMLHTANAETINYIISRTDSFSTLMIVISLCFFAYQKSPWKYIWYLIPMVIGFLVKEPAVLVGPLAFLYLLFFDEQFSIPDVFTKFNKALSLFWRILPAFIIAVGLYLFYKSKTPPTWTSGGYDQWHYLITEAFVMVHYVNNYFLPLNLSADTDWGLVTSWTDDRVITGVAFIAFTLFLAYRASLQAKWRPVTYGILWFYLALVPTSSIIPFSEVLNDHRVFFPYIGLSIAFVWTLFMLYLSYREAFFVVSSIIIAAFLVLVKWYFKLGHDISGYAIALFIAAIWAGACFMLYKNEQFKKSTAVLLILIFLAAHIYGVRERTKVWSSEANLWYDVSVKSPKNGRGLMNYGDVLMGKGDYNGALVYFNKAKAEWPYYSYIYVNLGVLYNAMGKYADAEQNFKYALSLNAQNPNCYYYYANMLKANGRITEAKGLVQQGLNLSPKHTDLLRLYNELNNPVYAGAINSKLELYEKLAKQQPSPENYINLSLEYYYAGRYQDCANAAGEALKLKPDYDLAYNNICSAYNMLHEWDKAIQAGQKAVALNPKSELARNNLKVSLDGKKSGK